jgi:hypothetical protein
VTHITTDYLVVGAGALAMAFVDELLTETDFDVVMVDRRHMPGGHWCDGYSFVRLHQPSAFYGVGSRRLGSDRIDAAGSNAGYYELATGPQIVAYYDQLMRERFLPSGRVRYLPMHDHLGGGRIASLLSGEAKTVTVRRKLVDATYSATVIPATHKPAFEVADGVRLVTPNDLPRAAADHRGYVVLGAGKTAMDACVWLMQSGADPAAIRWVRPRDAWLSDRDTQQPGAAFLDRTLGGQLKVLEASASAASADDLLERLERAGPLLRIDPTVRPTMFRNAIISRGEIEMLRRITDVVRKGRVRRIERDAIALDDGVVTADPDRLYIDCTAKGLSGRPGIPVFDGDTITLQKIRSGLICLSAALAAHVEAAYEDEVEKNAICMGMIAAYVDTDWLRVTLADLQARARWAKDPDLLAWFAAHRLSGIVGEAEQPVLSAAEEAALRARIEEARPRAEANLARLVAELDAAAAGVAREVA